MTWPVTQGLITQEKMDQMALLHHKDRCSAFDGGHANRAVGAGPLTDAHRIQHEATIASVIDVLQAVGLGITEDTE